MGDITILVIDDDPDMALATRMCLEDGGYNVIEARNGAEGLKLVLEHRPALVVLDVMMDTTTAGFQTALTLRNTAPDSPYAEFREMPIIMLTAIHSTTSLRFGPDQDYLPVDAFVDKPFQPEDLLKKVAALLAKSA